MSFDDVHARRATRARERRARLRRRRLSAALAALAVVLVAVVVAVALASSGSSPARLAAADGAAGSAAAGPSLSSGAAAVPRASGHRATAAAGSGPARRVPILMYHVIAPPPAGAPFPGLYVPAPEFSAQMAALKAAGWHAVTLDQLRAHWSRGVPLGPGKPVVVTFDNGYRSQYVNALPALQRLGWVGVENIQLSGLPPSQGGLTGAQVRGLIAAGWELDTQGISHADLIRLDASQLSYQVATARSLLRRRYGVPVDWFCYPSGHYDATVIAAVRAAGFVGSTTVIPGWASATEDPYRLPRLRVLGGTSPLALIAQIAAAGATSATPASYGGA